MNKITYFLIVFLISTLACFSKDFRFIQVDSAMLSANNEASVNRHKVLIENINKQKNVEFIVFTGDNIAKANKENLECFIKLNKSINRPYYVVLGSKDVNRQKHLGKKDYIKIISSKTRTHKKIDQPNYVIEKGEMVFIVVDGSKDVLTTPMGYYKADIIDWLETQLSYYRDKNVVIFQHFPLIPPIKKESRCTVKPDDYLELLGNYDNVKAIFAGNFGLNSEQTVGNILHVTTANAPQYRIVDILDSETKNPTFWSVIKE